MKNIPIREVIVFILVVYMIVDVSQNVLPDINMSALKASAEISASPSEPAKSVIWFIDHRDEARTLIQKCRKDISLANTENCINAEYGLKIAGQ